MCRYSSDLLPAPLISQCSVLLAIVENVLWIRCGCLYSHSFPSVQHHFFARPVSSSANFVNLLVNRCEWLHFRVVAPVPSLLCPVALLSANFENVLYIRIPYLAVEFSVDTSHSSSLINFLLVTGMNTSPA